MLFAIIITVINIFAIIVDNIVGVNTSRKRDPLICGFLRATHAHSVTCTDGSVVIPSLRGMRVVDSNNTSCGSVYTNYRLSPKMRDASFDRDLCPGPPGFAGTRMISHCGASTKTRRDF